MNDESKAIMRDYVCSFCSRHTSLTPGQEIDRCPECGRGGGTIVTRESPDLRELTAALEQEIGRLLQKFTEDTGAAVDSVDIADHGVGYYGVKLRLYL